jgi:hypothetical protein
MSVRPVIIHKSHHFACRGIVKGVLNVPFAQTSQCSEEYIQVNDRVQVPDWQGTIFPGSKAASMRANVISSMIIF